jgi:hypothetical protein
VWKVFGFGLRFAKSHCKAMLLLLSESGVTVLAMTADFVFAITLIQRLIRVIVHHYQ